MGWCHEFGVQIRPGCGHPMEASSQSCVCRECGTTCTGHFGGCPDVWARGPVPVTLVPSARSSTSVRVIAEPAFDDATPAPSHAVNPVRTTQPPAPGADGRGQIFEWLEA